MQDCLVRFCPKMLLIILMGDSRGASKTYKKCDFIKFPKWCHKLVPKCSYFKYEPESELHFEFVDVM